MSILEINWTGFRELAPKSYTCGHCGEKTGARFGYETDIKSGLDSARIYICGGCNQPTYFREGKRTTQIPSPVLGRSVTKVPESVNALYEEARKCTSLGAYNACVMCCRKILMHIGVEKGAKEGLTFVKYIDHLNDNGYIPPDGKKWVDPIRKQGNVANHKIVPMQQKDASKLLIFVGALLVFIYEMPGLLADDET